MKILLSILIPVALIATGFIGYRLLVINSVEKWDANSTHAVWIEEMEVSAKPLRSGKWDDDGSAPDLVASLAWRDNVVLKTPEASNPLLPHWERTAVQLTDLFKSNFSPTELENIARIRGEGSELLTIEAQDVDILSTEWAGAISIPCSALSVGKNKIVVNSPDSGIRSITLRVATQENLQRGQISDKETTITEGVMIQERPHQDAPGAVEVREVGKQLESGAKFLKSLFDKGDGE